MKSWKHNVFPLFIWCPSDESDQQRSRSEKALDCTSLKTQCSLSKMKSLSKYVTTAFLSLRSLNSLANMMDKEAICMISQLNFHFHWFLTSLNFLNSHRQRKLQKKFCRLSELFQILAISELLILNIKRQLSWTYCWIWKSYRLVARTVHTLCKLF